MAAGSIARLRGGRMSTCSNPQWSEFGESKGGGGISEDSQWVHNIRRQVNGHKTMYDFVE